MSKELVISAASHERRVAILEEGQLVEIYIEREKEFALVGSIYKGRVTRVLPGMQSAFVDIGLDGDAFLYVSDVFENLEDGMTIDELIEQSLHLPVRIAEPKGLAGLPEQVAQPEYATVIGLVMYGAKARRNIPQRAGNLVSKLKAMFAGAS